MEPEVRKELIDAVNRLINLPFVGEKIEASLIGLILDLLYPLIERYILKQNE